MYRHLALYTGLTLCAALHAPNSYMMQLECPQTCVIQLKDMRKALWILSQM